MLGITYTYIECNVTWCEHNRDTFCSPPKDSDFDRVLTIKNGKCESFKPKKAPKKG